MRSNTLILVISDKALDPRVVQYCIILYPKGPLSPPKPIPVYNHTTYFQIPCFYYLYLWNVGKPSAQMVAVASEATTCLGQSQATLLRPASDY